MGSDGNPLRSPARLPHADGPVIAKIDGQFRHGQLTLALSFLTMPSTVGQVRYTHLGFVLHENRPHLPAAPHGQRKIHGGRLIVEPQVSVMFYDVVQLRTVLVVTPAVALADPCQALQLAVPASRSAGHPVGDPGSQPPGRGDGREQAPRHASQGRVG